MEGLDTSLTQGEFNNPRVFIQRQIDLFGNQPDELKAKEVPAQTILALLIPENFTIPSYPLTTEGDIKNNSIFDIYNYSDGVGHSDATQKLRRGMNAVNTSELNNGLLRAFLLVYLKNEKHPLPIANSAYIREEESGAKLRGKIYKDQYGRVLNIHWENIQSIKMLTLTTIRGFQRAQKQKASCAKYMDDTSTEFNLDVI